MKNGIYSVTLPECYGFHSLDFDLRLWNWIEASRPLLVGMYQDKCICLFGTIPTSLLSDAAYIWLWTQPDIPKIAFARYAKRAMPILLSMYSSLVCSCFNVDSARWLRSLGAIETSSTTFTFRRL